MPDVTVACILEEDGLALKCNHSPLKFLICTHLYALEFNSQACRYERGDRDGNRKCLANSEVTIFLNVKNITIMANKNDNDNNADGNASGNSNGHGDNKDNSDASGNDGDNHGEGEDEHEA